MSDDTNPVSVSSNSVSLTCPMIEAMKYKLESLEITPLQPIRSLPTVTQSSEHPDTWTITLECGVQPSSEVAKNFNRYAGGSAHEYAAADGGAGEPAELDFLFAVEVTMLREEEKVPITLWFGQATSGGSNSWWLGSDFLLNHGDPMLLVITERHHVKVLLLSGTSDSFTLTPVSTK